MSFWESKKIKKTRKVHRCEYCNILIPIGSSCNNEVGTYEGDFNNYYLCERCLSFIDIFADRSEQELGEFSEELFNTNLLDCPICKNNNRREYEFINNNQSIEIECDDCGNEWVVDLSVEAIDKLK